MDILYYAEYYKICLPHVTVLLVTVRLFVNVYFVFANKKNPKIITGNKLSLCQQSFPFNRLSVRLLISLLSIYRVVHQMDMRLCRALTEHTPVSETKLNSDAHAWVLTRACMCTFNPLDSSQGYM